MEISARRAIRLPREDSGLQHSIIRFNNHCMDAKRTQNNRFHRREPVEVINPETNTSIIRFAMGSPGLPIKRDEIGIDYDGVDALRIRFNEPVNLIVRRAGMGKILRWFYFHPDLHVQLSTRLGVLGVLLGAVGLITSLISLAA